jgi:hypothetical protein
MSFYLRLLDLTDNFASPKSSPKERTLKSAKLEPSPLERAGEASGVCENN